MKISKYIKVENKKVFFFGKPYEIKRISVYRRILVFVDVLLIIVTIPVFPFGGFLFTALGIYVLHLCSGLKKAITFINNQTASNVVQQSPVVIEKDVTPNDLNFQSIVNKYLFTSHEAVPNQYSFKPYLKAEFRCILNGIPDKKIHLSESDLVKHSSSDCNYISKLLTKNTSVKRVKDFISIDIETTGLRPDIDEIIELSAIKFVDFRPVEKFHALIKPQKQISQKITTINGIDNDMVENSPSLSQIKTSFENFIAGFSLVAHNAHFDVSFLFGNGIDLSLDEVSIFDTLTLSRRIIRQADEKLDSYKLIDVCDELNICFDNNHRSDADALACGLLFIELVKTKKETSDIRTFFDRTAVKNSSAEKVVEAQQDEDLLVDLPFSTISTCSIALSDEETKIVKILFEIFTLSNKIEVNKIKLERRTTQYLTIVVGEQDFLRIKVGSSVLWFSISVWFKEFTTFKNDSRFAEVKNKNQRHWKIYLDSPYDLVNYSDVLVASCKAAIDATTLSMM